MKKKLGDLTVRELWKLCIAKDSCDDCILDTWFDRWCFVDSIRKANLDDEIEVSDEMVQKKDNS